MLHISKIYRTKYFYSVTFWKKFFWLILLIILLTVLICLQTLEKNTPYLFCYIMPGSLIKWSTASCSTFFLTEIINGINLIPFYKSFLEILSIPSTHFDMKAEEIIQNKNNRSRQVIQMGLFRRATQLEAYHKPLNTPRRVFTSKEGGMEQNWNT